VAPLVLRVATAASFVLPPPAAGSDRGGGLGPEMPPLAPFLPALSLASSPPVDFSLTPHFVAEPCFQRCCEPVLRFLALLATFVPASRDQAIREASGRRLRHPRGEHRRWILHNYVTRLDAHARACFGMGVHAPTAAAVPVQRPLAPAAAPVASTAMATEAVTPHMPPVAVSTALSTATVTAQVPTVAVPTALATAAVTAQVPTVAVPTALTTAAVMPPAPTVVALPTPVTAAAMPRVPPVVAPPAERGAATAISAPALPLQPLNPKTLKEAAFARVVRYIFRTGPAVIDKKKKTVTRALAVPYFASMMAFMAGPIPGGTREGIHAAALEIFSSSLDGWLWLCRLCGVCDRGLFLVGRILPEHQFAGQPSSVNCGELVKGFNPEGGAMWGSRRFAMRPELDLWDVDLTGPGSPSAEDLAMLRAVLGTSEGVEHAAAAGFTVAAGPAGLGGAPTATSKLVFDWSALWVSGSAAAALVEEVEKKAGFFKPPYNDLVTVKNCPVVPLLPPPHHSATGSRRKRRATSARAAASSQVDATWESDHDSPRASSRAETRERAMQRLRKRGGKTVNSKVSTRNAVDAAASFVPASLPALSDVLGCLLSTIDACAAWPRGGWGAQIPSVAFLDSSPLGKVCLRVSVLPQPGPPPGDVVVCDGGINSYRLVVTQKRIEPTPETKALAKFVRAADGVSRRCHSVEMLKKVRRTAEKKLRKDAEKKREELAAETAMSNLRAAHAHAKEVDQPMRASSSVEEIEPSTQSCGETTAGNAMDSSVRARDALGLGSCGVATDLMDFDVPQAPTAEAMDLAGADGGGTSPGSSPLNVSDVRIRLVYGQSPPVQPYSFSFSFSSDLLLRRRPTHVRNGGRLWVVADVQEELLESSGSDA